MTDFLSALSGLTSTTVLIALIITSSLLVILADWRLLNLLLGVEYLLIGVFLIVSRIDGFPAELAIVKALVGVMIVPALYISSRRARWGKSPNEEDDQTETPRRRFEWLQAPGLALRLIVALLGVAVALSLALRSPIQFITPQTAARDITIATFVLIGQGLLNMALNENPLKVGLGLLTVTAGFELFYTPVEPTLRIVALLGLVNLMIALALAYLITAWAARPRRGALH
ncbi:MAG TPA: hypothetical protein VJG32_16695 [Anaerolineae bacterium]|nr:hypothetical protein [Anaerolineae bacterium]